MLLFTGILLVVLWLIQICYLEPLYKMVKKNTAKDVTADAIELLKSTSESSVIEEQLDRLALRSDMAIMVTDMNGNICYDAEYIATSKLNTLPSGEILYYLEKAKANGGTLNIEFKGNVNKTFLRNDIIQNGFDDNKKLQPDEKPEQQYQRLPRNETQEMPNMGNFVQNYGQDLVESIIYVNLVETEDMSYLLLTNIQLTPVDATVDTLRMELVWITGIMVILSLVIALLISKQITKSFIKINDSAKEMAKGNFDVVFEGNDYKEVAELSDTLSLTASELNKSERFRKELIANVSHDLRTPLTMIIAYAEVMRDLPGENTPENVQVVIDEAERLTNLVNDMLDISKLEVGVMQKNVSEYNLTESIESVFERYNKLKEQDGYTIDFEYDRKVVIEADEYKIFQVIYNLVNNAINYSGESKHVLVRQIVKKDVVRIEVIDNGEGIEPEALKYVWDRYYKVDKTHKRAVMGTGLGLSIVKNILELHQAKYGVESQVGVGSTFWFELEMKP